MTERDEQCFDELKGRWGAEHSAVLQWADTHPVSMWKDPEKDGMPMEIGEYLIVIKGAEDSCWLEIGNYDLKCKTFIIWDSYNDCEISYKKKDVKFWMKIPKYK